jgi:Zn-dependent protease with chaperone function
MTDDDHNPRLSTRGVRGGHERGRLLLIGPGRGASLAPNPPKPRLQRCYDSVRRLAARAAIPMPRLFVMPDEQANAFATGRNRQHVAVAVTAGLLLSLPPG